MQECRTDLESAQIYLIIGGLEENNSYWNFFFEVLSFNLVEQKHNIMLA